MPLQILRFMGDPHLNGAQENLLGNYIIQKGLSNPGLRDEILCQIANQVWRNSNPDNAERGWLLLLGCLSAFAPSDKIEKYLLKWDLNCLSVCIYVHILLYYVGLHCGLLHAAGLCQTMPIIAIRQFANISWSRPCRSPFMDQRQQGLTHCPCWNGLPTERKPIWSYRCTVLMVRVTYLHYYPVDFSADSWKETIACKISLASARH